MAFLWHNLVAQFQTPLPEDYPDVVISLDSAKRHKSVSSSAEKWGSKEDKDEEERASNVSEDTERRRESHAYDIHTMEGLRAQLDYDSTAFGSNSTYDRKSKLINMAIQDMGMGKYQWELFVLCGFGWFADNFWLQGIALILPQLELEFGISENRVRFTTMALFIGLTLGASFWGVASDVIGRRLAFNSTLFITAVFGLAIGGGNDWTTICALAASLGCGVGGNLPVDGALFLEFLPFASGSLLTGLSVWWPVGSLVASLIAWGLIPAYSCNENAPPCIEVGADYNSTHAIPCCSKTLNYGWRYFMFVLGTVTFLQWGARFFLFRLYESPKFLLSKGRQREALGVVYAVAKKNKKQTWLTEEILEDLGGAAATDDKTKLSNVEIVKKTLSKFSVERFKPLFQERKIALTTLLLWWQWATIGMAYPLFNAFLPQYLGQAAASSTYLVYRNYAITNVVGVPGSILAIWTVNIKYIGRRGTMGIATMVTGIFIFLFTTTKDPSPQLAFSSLEAFFQNISYGVLFAYTPEVFPAPNRGTGTGISSTLNRIAGFCAPIVGVYATSSAVAPIYASGALYLAAFASMCFLPIETRGRQSL